MFPPSYFATGLGSVVLQGDQLIYRHTDGTMYTIDASFNPMNIAGLQLWLRPESIVNTVDGAPVSLWVDSSGNSRHASQSNSNAQPTFRAVSRSGWPAVRFNGMSQALDGGTANWQSFFAVARCSSTPTDHMSLWGASSPTIDISIRRLGQGPTYCHGNANDFAPISAYRIDSSVTNSVPNNVWHLVSCLAPNPQSFPYRVGGTGPYVGQRQWAGEIAEVLVYSSALSIADFQRVEQYLARKYTLPDIRPATSTGTTSGTASA